ncbi:hypothetical protein H5410_036714 [Solanum commersonii]|uniref:Uncharacterized protein n=1 Tax=Solanum commersonii TaxID=4109 RepID=A0A9J5Y623_SOLCO|nr:hypothetical protein H5410_036714 [Solanum commersonii]
MAAGKKDALTFSGTVIVFHVRFIVGPCYMPKKMPFFPSQKLLVVPGSRRFDLLGWVLCLLIPLLNHPSFH